MSVAAMERMQCMPIGINKQARSHRAVRAAYRRHRHQGHSGSHWLQWRPAHSPPSDSSTGLRPDQDAANSPRCPLCTLSPAGVPNAHFGPALGVALCATHDRGRMNNALPVNKNNHTASNAGGSCSGLPWRGCITPSCQNGTEAAVAGKLENNLCAAHLTSRPNSGRLDGLQVWLLRIHRVIWGWAGRIQAYLPILFAEQQTCRTAPTSLYRTRCGELTHIDRRRWGPWYTSDSLESFTRVECVEMAAEVGWAESRHIDVKDFHRHILAQEGSSERCNGAIKSLGWESRLQYIP